MKRTHQCSVLSADGKEPWITELDDFDHEIALTRQNKELMELLDERSREEPSYPLEMTRSDLGLENVPSPTTPLDTDGQEPRSWRLRLSPRAPEVGSRPIGSRSASSKR